MSALVLERTTTFVLKARPARPSGKDRRRNRQRPDRVSVAVPLDTIDLLDDEARRRGCTRYDVVNDILGALADELEAS